MPSVGVAYRPQLLTYPDSLGGDLRNLAVLLDGPLAGLFRGVHILPPFPSSGDRGFAPLTYRAIDSRFGNWLDIRRIGERHDVLLDLMINHLSRQSPEFRDFEQRGRSSRYADMFITLDKIWPDGTPPAADVARIFLRKPESPFSTVTIVDSGYPEQVWTSFGTADWSEQIDLDVTSGTALLRFAGRADRPPRRGRVRREEARHELLHGGARDLRLPRLGVQRCRVARTGGPARGP
jgi:glycosidase